MRRAISDVPEAKKRQATLGAFFRRPDGTAAAAIPRFVPDGYSVKCDYCDRVLKSSTESALPGALKVHCLTHHGLEYTEVSARVDAAVRYVHTTVFDYEPMETIPEEPVAIIVIAEPPPAAVPNPKQLRHSYKQKFHLLKDYDTAEARLSARLGPERGVFAVSVLDVVHRASGVPISTIKDWLKDKTRITATYLEGKAKRKLARLGSGKTPLFPKSEVIVANLVLSTKY